MATSDEQTGRTFATEDLASLGERLELLIDRAGFKSARDFCTAANIPEPTISRLLSGTRGVSVPTLLKMAKVLGVTTGQLLGESPLPSERMNVVEPSQLASLFDEAFVRMSYANPAKASAYCLAARELRQQGGVSFYKAREMTVEHAENLIRLHVGELVGSTDEPPAKKRGKAK